MLAACPVKPGRNGEPVNFALRPYQREAIAATIKGFDEFRRQLIVCPTGSGKTLIFAKIAEHYSPGRTLVLAHREELLEQAREDPPSNRYRSRDRGSRTHCQPRGAVVVACVQTLTREHRRRRFCSRSLRADRR